MSALALIIDYDVEKLINLFSYLAHFDLVSEFLG